jgi:hypothetical protein
MSGKQMEVKGPSSGAAMPLFLVFLVLKLTGVIGWSYWWVTAPLWVGAAFVAAAWIFVLTLILLVSIARGLRA